MAETVNQYQQGTFTSPVVGETKDPAVVLANDNNIRTKHNSHDADSGIHFQSSVLASRPAAGAAGRKWLTTDGLRVYYDTGAAWSEIQYLSLAAGGTVAGATTFSAAVTLSSTLAVTSNATVGGTLGVTGATTLAALAATTGTFTAAGDNITLVRAAVGSVTFGIDNVVGAADLTVNPVTAGSGIVLRYRTAGGVLTNGLTIDAAGAAVFAAGITATTGTFSGAVQGTDLIAGAGSNIEWAGRSVMLSPADGIITLYNDAVTGFTRLQFGGTSSSFPSLKRSSAAIHCRLADDSDYASFAAAGGTFSGAVVSTSASGGVGYATGAGGAVTQITSKSTGVTLNTVTGQITTHNANLVAGSSVTFVVTNSRIAATDVVVLGVVDIAGVATGNYRASVDNIASGSFSITLTNQSGGDLAEAVPINFAVIKGVTA